MLAETIARLKAEHTVLFQKKRRLDTQLEGQVKETRLLNQSMGRLDVELQRINGMIARNSAARETLKVRLILAQHEG
jgi:hypothetical protein